MREVNSLKMIETSLQAQNVKLVSDCSVNSVDTVGNLLRVNEVDIVNTGNTVKIVAIVEIFLDYWHY